MKYFSENRQPNSRGREWRLVFQNASPDAQPATPEISTEKKEDASTPEKVDDPAKAPEAAARTMEYAEGKSRGHLQGQINQATQRIQLLQSEAQGMVGDENYQKGLQEQLISLQKEREGYLQRLAYLGGDTKIVETGETDSEGTATGETPNANAPAEQSPAEGAEGDKPKEKPITDADVAEVKELQKHPMLEMAKDMAKTAEEKATLEKHFLAIGGYRLEEGPAAENATEKKGESVTPFLNEGKDGKPETNVQRVEGFAQVAALIFFTIKVMQLANGKGEKPADAQPGTPPSPDQLQNGIAMRNNVQGLSVSNNAVQSANVAFDQNGQPYMLMRLPGGTPDSGSAMRIETPKGTEGGSISVLPDGTIRVDGISNLDEDGTVKILKAIEEMKNNASKDKVSEAPADTSHAAVPPEGPQEDGSVILPAANISAQDIQDAGGLV